MLAVTITSPYLLWDMISLAIDKLFVVKVPLVSPEQSYVLLQEAAPQSLSDNLDRFLAIVVHLHLKFIISVHFSKS